MKLSATCHQVKEPQEEEKERFWVDWSRWPPLTTRPLGCYFFKIDLFLHWIFGLLIILRLWILGFPFRFFYHLELVGVQVKYVNLLLVTVQLPLWEGIFLFSQPICLREASGCFGFTWALTKHFLTSVCAVASSMFACPHWCSLLQ